MINGDPNSRLALQTSLECTPSPGAVDIQVAPQLNLDRVNFDGKLRCLDFIRESTIGYF